MFSLFQNKHKQLTIDEHDPFLLHKKETILTAALRQNIDFPHSCRVGGCGSCKCKLLAGQVKELTEKAYLLSKQEISEGYILGCQSIPKNDVVIQLPTNISARQKAIGTISRQVELTDDIFEVFIDLESPVDYIPGQYSMVKPIAIDIPPRAYSFAHTNTPSPLNQQADKSNVSFLIRAIPSGNLSHWLVAPASLGQKVEISGGQGQFYLRNDPAALLCIATGSGLAPLIALLEHGLSQQQIRPVTLLFGAKYLKNLYYLDEIQTLTEKWPAEFKFVPVLSNEPEQSEWTGDRGFVTDLITEHCAKTDTAYLCGPPQMIDAAINILEQHGITKDHILFDKFADQTINDPVASLCQQIAGTRQ